MTKETSSPLEEEIKPTRLSDSDWLVSTALWEAGEASLQELSDRFGVSKAAISAGLKKRGAVRGSKMEKTSAKIHEKIASEKDKLVEDIYNFKKRFIKYGDFLMTEAITTLKEAKTAHGGYGSARNDLISINEATKTLKSIRNDLYFLYDLYEKDSSNQDDLSFNIGVYSESDIEALRMVQEEIVKSERQNSLNNDDEEAEIDDDRVFEEDEDI